MIASVALCELMPVLIAIQMGAISHAHFVMHHTMHLVLRREFSSLHIISAWDTAATLLFGGFVVQASVQGKVASK